MTVRPSSEGSVPSPLELLELALKVAERASGVLMEGAGRARSQVESKSSPTDMVTEIDRASEEVIVSALTGARPEDEIVAEEGSSRPGTSGLRWVIDPLDGTTNYLYGFGSWAVSIAAETDEGVQAGVVVDAAHGETFTAARGQGARRDGEAIACSEQTDLAHALVGTGFAYAASLRREQAEALVELLPRVRDIRRAGSAALDLCWLACGRVDAYYERGLSWWDHAAGSLIAGEAGAVLGPIPGRSAEPGTLAGAAPGIVDPFRELLRAVGA